MVSNEVLKREIMRGEIAVTLNACPRSAWSVTPESSADRSSVLFTIAVGKVKSEKNYHWKALRTTKVLDIITMQGFVIVTLCANESIAKLFVKVEERHPFNVEWFIEKAASLVEPWRKCICQTFGQLTGMEPVSIDVGDTWYRLSKMVDRHAAGFASKMASENEEPITVGQEVFGKHKAKVDPKIKRAGKMDEKRARSTPQSVQPAASSGIARSTRSAQVGSLQDEECILPETLAATLSAPGVSLPTRNARPKQFASKKIRTKPSPPTPIPASIPLNSHPGVDDDDGIPEETSETATRIPMTNPEVSRDTDNPQLGGAGAAESAVIVGPTPGRVDDVLKILPRPSARKPPKVRILDEKSRSANHVVVDLDRNFEIPDELETEISVLDKLKKGEDKDAELRKRALLNEKFARESEYMYIFGTDQLSELALTHMEPSDHRSGRIYRDYEKKGAEDIKRNLILANFTKPVLTVMPNLQTRPRVWTECVNAGKFKIINGQHTWHAAISYLNDPELRQSNPRIKEMKIWDVQVVWTEKVSHLHALSFKCNKGQNESRHLTSLL